MLGGWAPLSNSTCLHGSANYRSENACSFFDHRTDYTNRFNARGLLYGVVSCDALHYPFASTRRVSRHLGTSHFDTHQLGARLRSTLGYMYMLGFFFFSTV
jgi:hypothetical protein